MSESRETYVKLTEEELNARLKDAAAEGARQAVEQLKEMIPQLDRGARVEVGVITKSDIADIYGVAPRTVDRWGLEPIGAPGRQNFYDIGEIKNQITD